MFSENLDGLNRELVGFSEVKPLVFEDPAHPQTTVKGSKQVTKSSVLKIAVYSGLLGASLHGVCVWYWWSTFVRRKCMKAELHKQLKKE